MAKRAKQVGVPLVPSLRESLEVENRCRLINGFIYGGALFGVPGYKQMGSRLNGVPVKFLDYVGDSGTHNVLVFTTREIYQFLTDDWVTLTPRYSIGTITCAGDGTVLGTGTEWLANVTNTSILVVDGNEYQIKAVVSDTELSLESNGPNVTDAGYEIRRCFTIEYDSEYDSLDAVLMESAGVNWAIVGTNRDGMFKWNGSGTFVQMPGAKDIDLKPRVLTTFKNRLIAMAPNEVGIDYWHRYRWSTIDDYDDWIGPGSGFEDVIGGAKASRIVGQITTNKIVLLETEDAYVINYIGGDDVFRVSPVNFYTGAVAKEGHVRLDIGELVLNQENFFIYYEGAYSTNLVDKLATDRLDYDVNTGFHSCAARWGRYNLGLLTVPRVENTPRLLVVNLKGDPIAWWESSLAVSALITVHPYSSSPSWDSIDIAWDDYVGSWDMAQAESLGKVLLVGTADGRVYKVDQIDAGLTVTWETKPFIPDVATRVNEVRLQARGAGVISLEYSVDYGETWTGLGGKTLSEETKELSWFPNKWCDSFKIRVTAPAYGLKLTRPYIYIIERRQR